MTSTRACEGRYQFEMGLPKKVTHHLYYRIAGQISVFAQNMTIKLVSCFFWQPRLNLAALLIWLSPSQLLPGPYPSLEPTSAANEQLL